MLQTILTADTSYSQTLGCRFESCLPLQQNAAVAQLTRAGDGKMDRALLG